MVFISRNKMLRFSKHGILKKKMQAIQMNCPIPRTDFFQKASYSDLELGQFNGPESLLQSISALMISCFLEKIGVSL